MSDSRNPDPVGSRRYIWRIGLIAFAMLVIAIPFVLRQPDAVETIRGPDAVVDTRPSSNVLPPDDIEEVEHGLGVWLRENEEPHSDSGVLKIVRFADGDVMRVPFTSASKAESARRALIDGKSVEELRELALEGDGTAAYRLYEYQRRCSKVPNTLENLEAEVAEMYQVFSPPNIVSTDNIWRSGPEDSAENVEERMRRIFSHCEDVRSDGSLKSEDYLRIAADYGSHPATSEFARSIEETYSATARQYFEDAWMNGDLNGALGLGRLYKSGFGTEPPDRVTAYAYLFLGTQLQVSLLRGKGGEANKRMIEMMEERSSEFLTDFYPAEVEQGTILAKSILNDYVRERFPDNRT